MILTSECFVGSSKEDRRWIALMDETFLRMVDDLMPWGTVCIRNSATVLGSAGKGQAPVLSQ